MAVEKQDFGMDTVCFFVCGCGEGGSWHCHGLLEKSVDTSDLTGPCEILTEIRGNI